ncbi:HAMP domain-containing histidine kinase [Thiomicrorhabdus cannonii]|uniref:HAMP domain-containing histidine kinase n=1 Tax=Thiomicrorhabdus cannonii TaxID=2748011 RepID=UPI0015BB5CCE|nr:HAMP domain-containing histidine kinase [Thiomicrorhabdus cannonii]
MIIVADWISVAFILIGMILLGVAYYVHRQTARLKQAISQLYALNQQVKQDALDFLEQAWPLLHSTGVGGMSVQIDWFGEHKEHLYGQIPPGAETEVVTLEREDMRFVLHFALPGFGTERISRLQLMITTFTQILLQDIEHKQAEILISQRRLERYQMFVQHEIKNIAQFVQLLSEQVASLYAQGGKDEDKLRLVDRLQQTLPFMSQRAANTVRQMKQPLADFFDSRPVDLNLLVEEVLQMYQLQADVQGQAVVQIGRPLLLEVFKNILGNYRDHPLGDCGLKILLHNRGAEGAEVVIASCLPDEGSQLRSERLFEPFWTTSESGMGLGLFLTRELLKQVGGEVSFKQHGREVEFRLQLNNVPLLCEID